MLSVGDRHRCWNLLRHRSHPSRLVTRLTFTAAGAPDSAAVAALAQQVAACDFQWVGLGLGAQDVVYLLWSSAQPELVREQEAALLNWYQEALNSELQSRGLLGAPPASVLLEQYEVQLSL